MEQLLAILKETKPHIDFETRTDLIDAGVLDSFDILSLINELNSVFAIKIPATEIVPQNFNSAAALWAMVQRLTEED